MTADLAYSIDALEGLGSGMVSLAGDLRSDGRLDHVSADDVNSSRVADAIDDFADNWDDNRESLARKVEALGKMASEAAKTLTEADEKLASEIREAFGSAR